MLFRLVGKLLKNLKWIIPLILTILTLFIVYSQYQALQNGPLGQFLPKTPNIQESIENFIHKVNPPVTPTPLTSISRVLISSDSGPITFSVEVASTPEQRALGLMYRSSIAQYNGMLFIHEYDVQYGYWMYNCEFPLDMIFIDSNYTIVDIKKNVPPCKSVDSKQENCPTYTPKAIYRYVLEINGGISDSSGIAIGQKISVQ